VDPHVTLDGDGGVHPIWWENVPAEGAVHHAVVVGGKFGEAETISDAMDVITTETSVLVRPNGEVCAFFDGWLDEEDLSTRGYYMRCLSGGTWSAPELVTAHGVTSTFDPAFDAAGAAHAIATTPVSSVTYEEQELSGQDATAQAQLVIDATGAYHIVWAELGQDSFALNHRVSTDGGATWSPIEALEGTEFFGPEPEVIAASDGSVHLFYETGLLFHRVWTSSGGWGEIEIGPECGGDFAFALGPQDEPVAACANIDGVHLTTVADGVWSELETLEGSTDAPAGPISIAVGQDGTRHLLWVASTDPVSLKYAAIASAT
jgi:hypothetical protein